MQARPPYDYEEPASAPRGIFNGMVGSVLIFLVTGGGLIGFFAVLDQLGGTFKTYPEAWFGVVSLGSIITVATVLGWRSFRAYRPWRGYIYLIVCLGLVLARCVFTIAGGDQVAP